MILMLYYMLYISTSIWCCTLWKVVQTFQVSYFHPFLQDFNAKMTGKLVEIHNMRGFRLTYLLSVFDIFWNCRFNQALILTQAPNNGRIVNNNNNVTHKICRTLKMLLHDWITTSVDPKYYPSCSIVRHLVFFTVAAKANKDTETPNYETLVYNFDHSYEYFNM